MQCLINLNWFCCSFVLYSIWPQNTFFKSSCGVNLQNIHPLVASHMIRSFMTKVRHSGCYSEIRSFLNFWLHLNLNSVKNIWFYKFLILNNLLQNLHNVLYFIITINVNLSVSNYNFVLVCQNKFDKYLYKNKGSSYRHYASSDS